MPRTSRPDPLATQAWRLLFDFFIRTSPEREAILRRHGLTPNDTRALTSLDVREGRTMRSLAEAWGCDASNATWIVDRLEKRGFAVRKSHATDRRVKLVVLTPAGLKARTDLVREMHQPPPEMLALDDATLRLLIEGLGRLTQRAGDRSAARR